MHASLVAGLQEHYGELKEKPFYGKLVDYIISGPVVCIVSRSPSMFLHPVGNAAHYGF